MNNTHQGCCCQDSSDSTQEQGHSCGGCHCGPHQTEIQISEEETEFLKQLAQTPYLPLAQFVLKSTKSSHLESVALAPVYINNRTDSMETVKSMAVVLESLKDKGLITLDYEEPLENGNYTDYSDSALYAYFKETVAQTKDKDEFLFDIPSLEFGSIALTYLGQLAIESLDKLVDAKS
ncbi:Abi-alpha family protein [Clostridium aminobutyricum]|uniref:Uncharacterized protein n=1 Tax=Clostridium aminobutyricum TaxID=33953 RepID=A0A939IGF8_CLOAM|nr:Abi-alpha family protein [Clostridium aminobutyricum]MBN7771852.1 hypothetical protein [Clostridium aminobutyricum]